MGNTSCCSSCSPSQQDYEDVINKLEAVEDMSHIDEFISYIDKVLNAIDQRNIESIARLAKTNRVASSINSGGDLLENLLKRSNRHICKRDIMPKLNRETRKLVIDVANQAAQIKWVGVALSVVGFVLERIEQVSSNREECIVLLRYMCNLAKYIKQLDHHLDDQAKLNRVLQFIVEGSLGCISQMKSNALSKFFAAPVAAEDLRKLQAQLGHEYSELTMEAIIAVLNRSAEVLNRIPVVLPPSQGISPQAVGIEEARNRVTELLDMKSKSVKVVVIYGQGGIGKTTLATAVFSKLDLQIYKYSRVDIEQNCSEADLKLLQQQILKDLYDRNIQLRSLNEGREELSKNFKAHSSQPRFIFVDNALKQSDLEKLLPIKDLASLPAQSRILVTTRNLNETRIIVQERIERYSYQVGSLPKEEAHKLLCELALGSDQAIFDPTIDIDGLLQICQGIPLVLKMVGAKLCEHTQSVQACRDGVENLKSWLLQGEEGELSERMVDFVYNRLEASCKEAFLDIVFFFCNWERDRVAYSVGEIEFEELERAAFVNVTNEGKVNVHDILKARGRMLSPDGERIINLQSLNDVLGDEERIKKTKGIFLDESFELEARHLNLMKRCLRVLILRETRIVNGECKGTFENLRLLHLINTNTHSLSNIFSVMDASKHPKLAVFIGEFKKGSKFCEFSGITSSLKLMDLHSCSSLVSLPESVGNLSSLNKLDLRSYSSLVSLPESVGNLSSLNKLDLRSCSSLVSLPESVCNLSFLNELSLIDCSRLVSLPESVGNLSSLNKLDLCGCSSLVSLPESVGNLSPLNKLDLCGCFSLVSLSESVGNLSSLNKLNVDFCSSLVSLPESVCNLSSLNELSLIDCSRLMSLPESVGNLSSLNKLNLDFCSSLVSLPESVCNLSSLNELSLIDCSRLVSLPESVGNLSSLNKLDLCGCSSLVSLPESVGNLSSLNKLFLGVCSSLVSLPESVGNLSSLNELFLGGCSSLVSLPESVGNLYGLVKFYFTGCTQRSVLPESFGNLASLERLVLKDCEKLSNLPQNFGQLKCLKFVSIHGCRVLQSLSGDFECLSSLIAIKASECSQLEENTMDKLAKVKGLLMVDIDGSPMLKMRWEQVKEQYSLAVVECGRKYFSSEMYPYADVMCRAFFHSESKFLHVDENGQFGESACPAVGVKLWFLLKECDVMSTSSNSRCWEAVKKKWVEVVGSEGGQMVIVDVGGSWEERETRVRQALPHLPSGTRAWIAPDNRARLLFAHSVQHYYTQHFVWRREGDLGVQNCIVSTSTCVDEEGRRRLDDLQFTLPDLTPPFAETEYKDISKQLLSSIEEAMASLRDGYYYRLPEL